MRDSGLKLAVELNARKQEPKEKGSEFRKEFTFPFLFLRKKIYIEKNNTKIYNSKNKK